MIRFIKRMLAAFAAGLVLSLWILQNTPSFKASISKHLLTFLEREWNTRITVGAAQLNFFTCSLYFENGLIQSNDHKKYAWQFEQCKIYVSPFQFLFNNEICLDLAFNNLKGKSAFSNTQIDVVDHIFDIFTSKSPDINFAVSSLELNNVDLNLARENEHCFLHIPGSLNLQRKALSKSNNYHWYGSINLAHAHITRNDQLIAQKISGSIALDRDIETKIWSYKPLVAFTSPLLNNNMPYTVLGIWDKAQRSLTLHDTKKETYLTGTLIHNNNVTLKGSTPVSFLHSLVSQQQEREKNMQGICTLDLMFNHKNEIITTTGSLFFEHLACGTFTLQKLGFNFNNAYGYANAHEAQINGSCIWNLKQNKGNLYLTNIFSIAPTLSDQALAPFKLQPNDVMIDLVLDSNKKLAGTYKCTITNTATEKRLSYQGALLIDNSNLEINGSTGRGSYALHASLDPHPYLTSWRYTVGNKDLINFVQDKQNPFLLQGTCEWSLLRSFLHQNTRRLVFGSKCSFALTLDQSKNNLKRGTFKLHHGTFYIPEFHNLVHALHTNFILDLEAKKFNFSDLKLELSKGIATCPRATISWNDDYSLRLVHIPLKVEDLFINWKRDFYGSVYGNLLLNKLPETDMLLAGILILKQALLKDTFFNSESSSSFTSPLHGSITHYQLPCGLHIKLMTEKPIKAKMANIDAEAALNLTVMATSNKVYGTVPYIVGNVTLKNGTLKILNNKLTIERGKIQFIKNQMHDPIIDLSAKNRINKYLVNIHATGSLEKPNILLESTPDLTEEQIIGLLLAGSEHATLRADLPAMLLQNLNSLIWSNKKRTKTTAIFDGLTKTFKYVQITPNLNDSSGKQSLMKGSLSLNFNDQLRAQIHKNFTLQRNDFSAQLEYFLSDNINIKVVQDQRDKRGESGAEIEMRFSL